MSSSASSNHVLFEKLTENMQVIYRKAVDADQSLANIQKSGKGKFNYVFTQDAGFNVSSKRFMPYVEELASDIVQLQGSEKESLEKALPLIVKKMELMLTTLGQFKTTL